MGGDNGPRRVWWEGKDVPPINYAGGQRKRSGCIGNAIKLIIVLAIIVFGLIGLAEAIQAAHPK